MPYHHDYFWDTDRGAVNMLRQFLKISKLETVNSRFFLFSLWPVKDVAFFLWHEREPRSVASCIVILFCFQLLLQHSHFPQKRDVRCTAVWISRISGLHMSNIPAALLRLLWVLLYSQTSHLHTLLDVCSVSIYVDGTGCRDSTLLSG